MRPPAKAATRSTWRRPDVVVARPLELTRTLDISGGLKAVNSAIVKARVAAEVIADGARGRRRQGRPGARPARHHRIRLEAAPGRADGRVARSRSSTSRSARSRTTRRWSSRASSRRPRSTPRSRTSRRARQLQAAPRRGRAGAQGAARHGAASRRSPAWWRSAWRSRASASPSTRS